MLDPLRRKLNVFASPGPCLPCTGGAVSVKTADLDNIAFAPGIGTVLMQSATDQHINNVTLTKQPISTAMSFLPVLAGDDSTDSYWFNALDLPALSSPPATQPGPAKPPASKPSTSAPAGDTATATASATPLPSDASAPQVAILRLPRVTRLGVMPAAFHLRGTVAFWLSRATPAVVRLERRTPAGRYLLARRYVRKGHRGANALRVNVRGLRPGRYRALVGVPGRKAVSASFRIGRR